MTAPQRQDTFTNPVLPGVEAGDPWVVWHAGRYYLTATFDPEGGLWVYSSDRLSDWRGAEPGMSSLFIVVSWPAPSERLAAGCYSPFLFITSKSVNNGANTDLETTCACS
jgi:beta-xylosidase